MTWPEFRLSVWRHTVRTLVAAKESKRALALLNLIFAEKKRRNRLGEEVPEKMDAAGILGHELFANGDKEGAIQALNMVLASGVQVNPSEVGEYVISLAIALGDQSGRLPGGTLDGELESQILGRIRGFALIGDQARLKSALDYASKIPALGFRARVEMAIINPDDVNLRTQLSQEVLALGQRPEAQIAILRWSEMVGPGDLNPESIAKLYASMPGETALTASFGRGVISSLPTENRDVPKVPLPKNPAVGDLMRAALPGELPKASSPEAEAVLSPFLNIGVAKKALSPNKSPVPNKG